MWGFDFQQHWSHTVYTYSSKNCCGDNNLAVIARSAWCQCWITGVFLWPFVSVHISTDPRCHSCDCGGLPVPSAPASGRVSQGECRRLPCQPCCALEPRHWHRESPENGRTEGIHCLRKQLCFLFYLLFSSIFAHSSLYSNSKLIVSLWYPRLSIFPYLSSLRFFVKS